MWWAPIAAAAIGAIASRESNQANQAAANASAESQRPQLWPPASPYVNRIMGDATSLYNQGAFAPPPNELQLAGRQNQLNYAQEGMPVAVGAAQNSWLQGLQPGVNPYVGNLIQSAQNDLVQDYQRNIMPTIGRSATATGGYGGARHGVAEGIASEGLMENLSDVSIRMLNNAYNQQQGQQRAAWQMAPQMANLGILPGQIQQGIGQQYQSDQLQAAQNLAGYSNQVSPWTGLSQTAGVNYPAQYSPLWGALGGALNYRDLQNVYNDFTGQVTPQTNPNSIGTGGTLGGTNGSIWDIY